MGQADGTARVGLAQARHLEGLLDLGSCRLYPSTGIKHFEFKTIVRVRAHRFNRYWIFWTNSSGFPSKEIQMSGSSIKIFLYFQGNTDSNRSILGRSPVIFIQSYVMYFWFNIDRKWKISKKVNLYYLLYNCVPWNLHNGNLLLLQSRSTTYYQYTCFKMESYYFYFVLSGWFCPWFGYYSIHVSGIFPVFWV